MVRRRFYTFMGVLLAIATLSWGFDLAWAQTAPKPKKLQQITAADKKAAAQRAGKIGLKSGVAGLAATAPTAGVAAVAAPLPGMEGPGGIPHYFGPYGNWAYSPLPRGPVAAVTIVAGGAGYTNPIIAIDDAYGTGASIVIPTTVGAGGVVQPPVIPAGGVGADFSAPVATVVDDPALCGGGGLPACGTGALADAVIGPPVGGFTTGMRKFVDLLPGLGPTGANVLGQYIPVAVADTTSFLGSDYYEIALVEFTEKMHSDLPPTRLRGYVQLAPTGFGVALTNPDSTPVLLPSGVQAWGFDKPHSLGPIIVAQGRAHGVASPAGDPKPVRIKFYNLLPAGAGGNLFIPVDETVPGSGAGPAGGKYTQNRATIHLHGNNTVWISDGNTHQWITPANENTPYPKGVSARNVPDMGNACDPGNRNPVVAGNSGCQTFFYTNAQSARLQFYHDHAMGITRLNVYVGEAAGYVLTDAVEQDMIGGTNVSGVNPGLLKVLPDIGIPLVIQDRTWVDASTIYAQDPTWNWGTAGPGNANTGDLWYPHVYMSAQNPWDLGGVNAFGRWHYGPWFNPPVPTCVGGGPVGCIAVGPVPNEYYDPLNAPWEPPMRPGVPNPSIPGEGFMDTPTVNGTAYPVLKVEPKAYRFRVLSAANDRMFNLQLYVAHTKDSWTPPAGLPGVSYVPGTPMVPCTSATDQTLCTEVKMVPVSVAPANQYADWPSGIPDPMTKGPDWWLIGTEGGFLPKPVVVPQQPVGWNFNPTTFNFGVVNQHSLLLGSAERADVVVDFSGYQGKTLILYNDAPAAFPAGVPVYDYFTGVPNQMDTGGAPTTQPGYGPNTRTIMQIQVGTSVTPGTETPQVNLANLEAVFAKTATKRGVFEVSQEPIIIPQADYNSAYNTTLPSTAAEQYIQIADTAKTFRPIDQNGVLQAPTTLPLQMKAMHDEMGGVYDTEFGRMSGMLGLSNPLSPVHVLIPYGYASPPTDLVMGSLEATPVGTMPDGTQIWRIFHNGVDSHTIHTHLFHAQLVNRLAQDGILLPIDPIELGWKDTFRVNPLEITYLAMRPTVPTPSQLPFEAPDSIRLIDPTLPAGAPLIPPPPAGWFDPAGNAIPSILNHTVNFGWEYVWHCHILAHEEMDMMHSLVFAVPPKAPTGLTAAVTGNVNSPRVNLIWTDNSVKETGFRIERATNAAFTAGLTTFNYVNPIATAPSQVAFQDRTVARNAAYYYRVWALGTLVGDTQTAGFPILSADSVSNSFFIQVGTATPPAAPTGLTAAWQAGPQVSLTWTDNATTETGFVVERCTGLNCTSFAQIATPGPRTATGSVTYVDTTVSATGTYSYQVKAVNATGSSAYTNIAANLSNPAIPAAPTGIGVAVTAGPDVQGNYTVTLNWSHVGGATDFTIQRATNANFTRGVSSSTVAGSLRTATQTVTPNKYYYRMRANGPGGSSAWTNASPFPVTVP